MLPSKHRIKDKEVIKTILKNSKIVKTPLFNLYYKKTKPPFQLLVLISKKVSKKATERNRIKRQLHEIFKSMIRRVEPTTKIILVLKKEILTRSRTDIRDELEKVISLIK